MESLWEGLTRSTPKYTAPLVFEFHSICPAFSHSCVSKFFRWNVVRPVLTPVLGWWNCAHGWSAPYREPGDNERGHTLYSSMRVSDPSTAWCILTVRKSALALSG